MIFIILLSTVTFLSLLNWFWFNNQNQDNQRISGKYGKTVYDSIIVII